MEFRMKVHLFGNTSSPAVATFGLRKTAEVEEAKFGTDAKEFVDNDFYVDDGLKSTPTTEEAVDLLKRTQRCWPLQISVSTKYHQMIPE